MPLNRKIKEIPVKSPFKSKVKNMKAIVLAGGFAKRLLPLTKEMPKHLLDVGGVPMLTYVLKKIFELENECSKIYLSTNSKFKEKFESFLEDRGWNKKVELFIEDSRKEEEKLGSLGALNYLIKKKEIKDNLLVIGGDNIFEFSLKDMVNYFRKKNGDVIAVYDVGDKEKVKMYGVVVLNKEDKIIDFLEKPEDPPSTFAATACYLFKSETVKLLNDYINEGNNPDAMGYFVSWLYPKRDIFGFRFKGKWFDIGSFESLNEADCYFKKKALDT